MGFSLQCIIMMVCTDHSFDRVWGSQFGRGNRHCRTLSINELCDQTEYKGKYILCNNQMDVRVKEPDAISKVLVPLDGG
jgi:hypothetical protein